MREMLEQKLTRFSELETQLTDLAILADSAKIAAVGREHGSLKPLATTYRKFKDLSQQINDAKEMATGDDAEMRELAQ